MGEYESAQTPPAVKKLRGRKATGYLRGRGGGDATRTPTAAVAELAVEFAAVRAEIDALEAYLLGLDRALHAGARALDRSQPIGMWRRILLRWWRRNGGGRRTPLLVREVRDGGKDTVGLQPFTPGSKQRTDAGFGLCADLVESTLRESRMLMKFRAEAVEQLAEVKRVAGRTVARRQPVVLAVHERFVAARREAVKRLRDVGYNVAQDDVPGAVGTEEVEA